MTNTIQIHGHTIAFAHREDFFRQVERGEWEPFSFDVFDRLCVPGKTVIDIGAWVGILSLYAAKLGCGVLAFEPDEKAMAELEDNLNENDRANIGTLPLAVSNKDGVAMLNTQGAFGNSESSLIDRGGIIGSDEVDTCKLPTVIKEMGIDPEGICMVKIDCEGGELKVIEGMLEFLKEYRPALYIAMHPAWIPELELSSHWMWNALAPMYNFENQKGSSLKTWEDFYAELLGTDHTFILIAK